MSENHDHLKEFNQLPKEDQQALKAVEGPRKEEWEQLSSWATKIMSHGFSPAPFKERFLNKKTNKRSLNTSFIIGPAMVRYVNLDNPSYYDTRTKAMVPVTDPAHKDYSKGRFSITLWIPFAVVKEFTEKALVPFFNDLKDDSTSPYSINADAQYSPKMFKHPLVKRVSSAKDICYAPGTEFDFREVRIKGYPYKYETEEKNTFDCKGINNEIILSSDIKQGDMVMVSGSMSTYSVEDPDKFDFGISLFLNQGGRHSIQKLKDSKNTDVWSGGASGGSSLSEDQMALLQAANLSTQEDENQAI